MWIFYYLFQVCQGNHGSLLFWSFIMKNPVKFRLIFYRCTSQRITHGTRSDESNDFPSAQTPPPLVSRHLLRHLCWFSLHFNALSVCAASRPVELRKLKMNNFPSLQRWEVTWLWTRGFVLAAVSASCTPICCAAQFKLLDFQCCIVAGFLLLGAQLFDFLDTAVH